MCFKFTLHFISWEKKTNVHDFNSVSDLLKVFVGIIGVRFWMSSLYQHLFRISAEVKYVDDSLWAIVKPTIEANIFKSIDTSLKLLGKSCCSAKVSKSPINLPFPLTIYLNNVDWCASRNVGIFLIIHCLFVLSFNRPLWFFVYLHGYKYNITKVSYLILWIMNINGYYFIFFFKGSHLKKEFSIERSWPIWSVLSQVVLSMQKYLLYQSVALFEWLITVPSTLEWKILRIKPLW